MALPQGSLVLRCHFKIHYHPFYLLQIFTFSIQIMFSLISSEANDPQGLMRCEASNKQTNRKCFTQTFIGKTW